MDSGQNPVEPLTAGQERSDIYVVLPRSFAALTLCLVSYEANIDKVASNSFSQPVYSISTPYNIK